MFTIDAPTLGIAWVECLSKVMRDGQTVNDEKRTLLEVCNLDIKINSISRTDPIISKYANQERIKLMHKKHKSMDIVKPFDVSYGACLYCNQGIDQVNKIIKMLLEKRESKSATISLHTPQDLKPTCLSLIDCKIRNDKLNMTAVYRSQNIYGSQPGNILALSEVFENVAKNVGAKMGNFYLYIISAHIYSEDFQDTKAIIEHITKG
ncbi:MAG: thymidylate synthase [Deltaproteobacteria bacterium]|nr:thymidylate synthase [Deltaproteobacteria bacterium]